jgi:4-hydroxybenzoate polyprenyltransferase
VGRRAELGTYYWSAVGIASALIAYEFVLARHRDREGCFRAFLHNHWVGLVVFAGFALEFGLRASH